MSAFASSRQVNPWLSFKLLLRAMPGKAGDAVVIKTVDHTLMRNRMTVDASRSCRGLGTCVGSMIPKIVLARVLLAATAHPVLPGGSVSDGLLAPLVRWNIHFEPSTLTMLSTNAARLTPIVLRLVFRCATSYGSPTLPLFPRASLRHITTAYRRAEWPSSSPRWRVHQQAELDRQSPYACQI